MSTYFEVSEAILDTNSADSTAGCSSSQTTFLTGYIFGATGTHNTHIVELQVSPNAGNDWMTVDSLTGLGVVSFNIISDCARLKVSTPEGSASTCKVYLFGK